MLNGIRDNEGVRVFSKEFKRNVTTLLQKLENQSWVGGKNLRRRGGKMYPVEGGCLPEDSGRGDSGGTDNE